jgi:hypothetical protein
VFRIFQELKKMKEKEGDREREEWAKEVLSDKNPHTINYYKAEMEKKQEDVGLN